MPITLALQNNALHSFEDDVTMMTSKLAHSASILLAMSAFDFLVDSIPLTTTRTRFFFEGDFCQTILSANCQWIYRSFSLAAL
jgi:hypothetical protein